MSFAPHHSPIDDLPDLVAAAKSTTLTFDDIALPANGYRQMPADYGGLTWSSDFFVMNPKVLLHDDGYDGSGYFTGRTSGKQIAWNDDGTTVNVSASGHFDLKSVELTAGTDKKLVVDIYAFQGNTQVAHEQVTLTDAAPKLVKLNFTGVTEVEFAPGQGTADPKFGNPGGFIVFDDMKVAHVVNAGAVPTSHADALHPVFGGFGHPWLVHVDHPIA